MTPAQMVTRTVAAAWVVAGLIWSMSAGSLSPLILVLPRRCAPMTASPPPDPPLIRC